MFGDVLVNTNYETDTAALRKEAGCWLRKRREELGLSQRDLSKLVNTEYYTFISQIEAGRGRVPAERMIYWAKALQIDPREFGITLMRFYDPHSYQLIFSKNNEVID